VRSEATLIAIVTVRSIASSRVTLFNNLIFWRDVEAVECGGLVRSEATLIAIVTVRSIASNHVTVLKTT
ncbi:MAG: hypothetical protein ACLSU0_06300, partial [Oscillospiraceae bacterium]